LIDMLMGIDGWMIGANADILAFCRSNPTHNTSSPDRHVNLSDENCHSVGPGIIPVGTIPVT